MDGWQHLLRRQRSLQSEARSEHQRRTSLLPSRVSPVAHVGRRLPLTTLAASGPDTTSAAATAKNTNRCSGGAALPSPAPSLRPSPAPDRRPPWTLERVEGWRPRPEIVTDLSRGGLLELMRDEWSEVDRHY